MHKITHKKTSLNKSKIIIVKVLINNLILLTNL